MRRLAGALAVLALAGGGVGAQARAGEIMPRDRINATSTQPAASSSVLSVSVNPATGSQYVFWRGGGGRIYETWNTGRWHGPVNRYWIAGSAPSVGVTRAGSQYVFWEGSNQHIVEAWYRGGWHGPVDLTSRGRWGAGGITTRAPSVAVNPANGHQYVFWLGTDGHIHEAWYTNRWHGPVVMSWGGLSGPAAATTDSSRQYVFWQDVRGHLVEAWFDSRWHGPRDLTSTLGWGGAVQLASAPTAAVDPCHGRQYVAWLGTDSRLRETSYAGAWQKPVSSGLGSASAPGLSASCRDRRYLFWQAQDGRINHSVFDTSWGSTLRTSWLGPPGAEPWPAVQVIRTTQNLSERLAPHPGLRFAGPPPAGVSVIRVLTSQRFQKFTGVGGGMTDSSAWLIYDQLPAGIRSEVLYDLFGRGGLHLSLTVVPMGASDFTATGRPYTYDDLPAGQTDPALSHFSVAHDQAYILPALRQARALDPQGTIFATPWTAPPWMKANAAYDDAGHAGTLLPAFYRAYAGYFVKFLEAYAASGVPVSAIAPVNEPLSGASFPAMYLPEATAAPWMTGYLTPALAAAGLRPQLYGANVAWSSAAYANALLTSQAHPTLGGIAWHCYAGGPAVMSQIHAAAPALDQIVTECAKELHPYSVPMVAIGSLRNWANGVTLWNLALDPAGGPVQPPNSGCGGCTGLLSIDESRHTVRYNLGYYQLGQVGRYVQPGAVRIGSNTFVHFTSTSSAAPGPGLADVAFRNPDGTIVLLAYNNSAAAIRFAVAQGTRSFTYRLPAYATVTFSWRPAS